MIEQLTINVKGLLTERQPFGFEQAEELRLALNHNPGESTAQLRQAIQLLPVSYTHLTLPTSDLV